jgi:NAD(P)-dependent dehydrogenase (short-subunit alcohol dehydrogenase family)
VSDELSLEGRTVLITGAANGLGLAFARGFLDDGARVAALDIYSLDRLADEGALPLVADVSDNSQVVAAIEKVVRSTGRLDVLIANAGIAGTGEHIVDGEVQFRKWSVAEIPDGVFERTMAVNAFGTLHPIRASLPHMRRAGHGRIISLLSRAAELPAFEGVAYGASKAAQWAITMAAASEVASEDILINGLIPGPTNTGIAGRDMPHLQPPEAVYPAARRLATLPVGGPNGRVFLKLDEYPMFRHEKKASGTPAAS